MSQLQAKIRSVHKQWRFSVRACIRFLKADGGDSRFLKTNSLSKTQVSSNTSQSSSCEKSRSGTVSNSPSGCMMKQISLKQSLTLEVCFWFWVSLHPVNETKRQLDEERRGIECIIHTNFIEASLVLYDHYRQEINVSLRLTNGFFILTENRIGMYFIYKCFVGL